MIYISDNICFYSLYSLSANVMSNTVSVFCFDKPQPKSSIYLAFEVYNQENLDCEYNPNLDQNVNLPT